MNETERWRKNSEGRYCLTPSILTQPFNNAIYQCFFHFPSLSLLHTSLLSLFLFLLHNNNNNNNIVCLLSSSTLNLVNDYDCCVFFFSMYNVVLVFFLPWFFSVLLSSMFTQIWCSLLVCAGENNQMVACPCRWIVYMRGTMGASPHSVEARHRLPASMWVTVSSYPFSSLDQKCFF